MVVSIRNWSRERRISEELSRISLRKYAIQLDFFDGIPDNLPIEAAGTGGVDAPPAPNHDGRIGSAMMYINGTTPHLSPQVATRPTYPQNWPAYNAAQSNEYTHFVALLRDLCDGIPQPPQTFGRPRLPLSDVVFGCVNKVYTTMSGRRAMVSIREAEAKGLDKAPSFTSMFRYLENPELTPLLKGLIEQSALPLQSVETEFAVDSTGFATTTYSRWYDHKWGKERSRQTWVKAHIMCGVKTHIVTAVEATANESADAPQLPTLLERTASNFNVAEVSADKAYSSKRNLHAIDTAGAAAYIPFKNNVRGTQRHGGFDDLWQRAYHYFAFNRDAFLSHYHLRSNVESTMFMVKSKFGHAVRAKTPIAQVNEVLCKILCHNIAVLIQSWYELGIESVFESPSCSKSPIGVPKMAWE